MLYKNGGNEATLEGAMTTEDSGDYGLTPLHLAARSGDEDEVRALLQQGADINAVDKGQRTPLHLAAQHYGATALSLLEHGAKVDAVDDGGFTPLHMAAEGGDVKAITALVAAGAKLNAADHQDGMMPVHSAVVAGMSGATEALLLVGADVNALDGEGNTPLHLAVRHSPALVELLLERGADPSIANRAGETAEDWARERRDRLMIERLRGAVQKREKRISR